MTLNARNIERSVATLTGHVRLLSSGFPRPPPSHRSTLWEASPTQRLPILEVTDQHRGIHKHYDRAGRGQVSQELCMAQRVLLNVDVAGRRLGEATLHALAVLGSTKFAMSTMSLRARLLVSSNIRCALQQGLRLRAMSTQTASKDAQTEAMKPGQTHFGFQVVDEGEKTKKVHEVFETVAEKYDLMNDVMSMGIHRVWKDIFIQRLAPRQETKLLDMAGGTGDIAFRYIKYLQSLGPAHAANSSVTVCDINQAMLDVGKQRALRLGYTPEGCGVAIDWVCGDAEKLALPDDSFDAYTIAFGIRNCTHIDHVLEEAYRVLTPGGRFMCLEFSQLPNSTLQWVYDQYSFQVIPVLGQLFAGQWKPYQYLVESIRQFPNQEKFKSMIEDAGFRQVTYENLTFGTCAIHSGFKI